MQRLSLIFLVVLCLGTPALAQTAATGALTGTVLDASGAGIPSAKIAVKNETTGELRAVISQSSGNYVVPLLPPGRYRIELSKAGFRTTVLEGFQINVTETALLDPSLEVGAVQEQVEVSAEAQLLQTESSALGRVTDRAAVNDLPLVTRNYTQIVTLSPGIAANVTNASDLGRGAGGLSQGNFRVHGAGGADNNFQMNGLQINDLQSSGSVSGGIAIPDRKSKRLNSSNGYNSYS